MQITHIHVLNELNIKTVKNFFLLKKTYELSKKPHMHQFDHFTSKLPTYYSKTRLLQTRLK